MLTISKTYRIVITDFILIRQHGKELSELMEIKSCGSFATSNKRSIQRCTRPELKPINLSERGLKKCPERRYVSSK
jgi:hypothetical protein